ncbi:MAG: hypothetical protein IPM24_16175 [Bryobacterales bacterium]|nr:hypothetical protein [Bryobacterales bacterium]
MNLRDKAGHYARYSRGVAEYLRSPVEHDWRERLRSQLANREASWLATVRLGVFARPESPFARMFALAGIGYPDLAGAVERDGLEAALEQVRQAGVYLTHEEYKGHVPIVRSGREIAADQASFANPAAGGGIASVSSGSSGTSVSVRKPVEARLHKHVYAWLEMREFGLDSSAMTVLKPILPASSGLTGCIRALRMGCRVERWFAPGGRAGDSVHYRALTSALVTQARLSGVRIPYPEHLAPNDFLQPARWLAKRRSEGERCAVRAFVSPAVRTVQAALDAGLDIRGTRFLVGGEALTEAKRRLIESAGCEVFPRYVISEIGAIGYACSRMRAGNSVHLCHDSVAVVGWRRLAPLSQVEVNALLFTPLLPSAPQILINVEMGDAGSLIHDAHCDCAFAQAGLPRRIEHIASYSKLTGLGVTLTGTEVVPILESILPAQCGGGPADYQLVEREGRGQTELTLRVSPRVPEPDLNRVRQVFLRALEERYGGALASRVWRHAGAFHTVRAEPETTPAGKVLSLHLLKGSAEGDA